MREQWLSQFPFPSVGLVLGQRRQGKTALGYWLLEILSEEYEVKPYVVGLPEARWPLLQGRITPLPLDAIETLPPDSVCMIDEGAMHLFARAWQGNKFSQKLQDIMAVSGQRRQVLLVIAHSARKMDVGVLTDCDSVTYKQPSAMHARLERAEFRDMAQEALHLFQGVPPEDRKKTSFVFGASPKAVRLENPLPSFWSQDLSEAYGTGNVAAPVAQRPRCACPTCRCPAQIEGVCGGCKIGRHWPVAR